MPAVSKFFIVFIAVQHLLFLVVEMFLWQSEAVMQRFGTTPTFAKESAALAMNQGLYNGFLAAGLLWSLTRPGEHARATARFFLVCVVVAGIFGGLTAKTSILVIQAVPAAIALGLTFLGGKARAT